MKTFSKAMALAALACTLGGVAAAQDNGVSGPPKVLVINREFTKPGKGGALHERTESAFIAAVKATKAPIHYLAMTSMSGQDRALFFSGYPSFAAFEAESKAMDASPAMGAAMDRAFQADGDLLSETDESIWLRRDSMSLASTDLLGVRYFELELFTIKPGHEGDWEQIVKLVKDAYTKGVPGANWTMFSMMYGTKNSEYLVVTPLKSLAEIDAHMMSDDKKFTDAMGKDGMKKLEELSAAAIETEQTNLFHFSPKMSIPPPEWVAAEPAYWTPKPVVHARKPEPAKK
jgi:hypothetical protein